MSDYKENVDLLTPTKQNKQQNSGWDPTKHPPPLPLSPQMLRINQSKPSPNNSIPGKLQLTSGAAPIDISELEFQLTKVIDSQASLKNLVMNVSSSVKQTQLELESLVSRSTNNNSHLKDLISHVNESFNKKSKEDEFFNDINKNLNILINHKDEVLDKFKDLGKNNEISSFLEKQDTLLLENFEKLNKEIKSNSESIDSNIAEKITSSNELILDYIKKIDLLIKFNELQTTTNTRIEDKLKSLTGIDFQLIDKHLSGLTDKNELINNEISKFKDEHLLKINELNALVSNLNFNEDFNKILNSNNQLQQINGISEKLNQIITKQDTNTTDIKHLIETNATNNTELAAKDEIIKAQELKITELTNKINELSELKAKQDISESITQLEITKAKIEARIESLDEIYAIKYNQFKELFENYDNINRKINELNFEKYKSIYGATKIASVNPNKAFDNNKNNDHNGDDNVSRSLPLPKNTNSEKKSRVLSTNSYLQEPANKAIPDLSINNE